MNKLFCHFPERKRHQTNKFVCHAFYVRDRHARSMPGDKKNLAAYGRKAVSYS
jgi:hypothetical protein